MDLEDDLDNAVDDGEGEVGGGEPGDCQSVPLRKG